MEATEKWRRVAYSTEPVDRSAVETALAAVYELAGSDLREIVWCASPLEAARLVAAERERFGMSLRDRVRTDPWNRARSQLLAQLGREVWTDVWRRTCSSITPTVSRLTEAIATAVVAEGEDDSERTRLRIALTFADHGQHNAAWLPQFEAFWNTLDDGPVLHALAALTEQVHWWWPFEHTAVVCERPSALHLDELGRLHFGDGPALAYADGFVLHRWRGAAIPPKFAETLAALTPEIIRDEDNAERRRIMLEHYGYERYIVDSGAEPIQQDEAGRLWRVNLPDDEPITMVEVVNSTAEPDGTLRTYWLRVPPQTTTAKGAVAWTFGLSEEEYEPRVQT